MFSSFLVLCIVWMFFSSLGQILDATANVSKIILGPQYMAESSEKEHSTQERNWNSGRDDDCKFLECDKLSTKKGYSTTKCGDCTAEDTDSHFWVCLLDLIRSRYFNRVLVVSSQVNHIINCQTNHNYHSNRLRNSEFPTFENHYCHNTQDDDCHA